MAFFRDKPGCRPDCCGGGCILCADNFDRPDNADIASGAPGRCDWVEGGDSAFRVEGNNLIHPDASESWAIMPDPTSALSLPLANESYNKLAVTITFSSLGSNDGDAIGICFRNDASHRLVVQRLRGDSGNYDVLALITYPPSGFVNVPDHEEWHLFDTPVNGDITLCIEMDGYGNIDRATVMTYTGERVTAPRFLTSLSPYTGVVGLYAKGAVTVKSFTVTQHLEEGADCVRCSYQCLKEMDEECSDTPLPAYFLPSGTGTLSHEMDAWRVTGTPRASLNLSMWTCSPEFNNINKAVVELTRGAVKPVAIHQDHASWYVFVRFLRGTYMNHYVAFYIERVAGAWVWRREFAGPPGSGFPDQMSVAGSTSDGDVYAIAISNPTATVGGFVFEFLVNGIVVNPLTITGADIYDVVDANTYWQLNYGFSYESAFATPAVEIWAEIDRMRLFTT